jgi:hypothetical protein
MSRRKLPLESPNWWPIEKALEHRSEGTGSDRLACQDFNKALKAGPLRALVRRADGYRELLSASAWDDFYVGVWVRAAPSRRSLQDFFQPGGMAVSSHQLGKRPPGHWFYVWLPDYKNIFGDPHAKSLSFAQMQEVPEKRGRKFEHPWPEIGFELVRRAAKKGKTAENKSTNSWALELTKWCEDHYQKAPVDSDLREFIDDVLRALRIKRK